ncbi:BAG domain-containing protein Samui isoform X2 [Calliphora vicina]|uniref:BAG domain-containing protein Samui isoform X2 n=1 Tax=Calliphora vicina TaxID=7373 RepID=UPI00325A67DE
MKPTVISNANASASSGAGNPQTGGNGVTIPINHEYRGQPINQHQQQPQYHTQSQHYVAGEPQATCYGSPGSLGRGQQQQQPHPQQQIPAQFQDFDFEPDMGIDMFPRTRLGRMTHDPFGDFGGTSRKRTSLHDPQFHTDGFSRYFDDAADFGFPQFNSLGRRRVNPHNDDDFFNRLPSEFRQYIPESFAQRRTGSGMAGSPGTGPTMVHPQQSTQQQHQPHFYNTMPQSPSRKVCDAAIQTEDPTGRSEVDHSMNTENLNQHGLRNTMDMGVKSPAENENQSPRSSSAPPTQQQQHQTQPQQIPVNGPKRPTPPPQQQHQFATQTSPQIQSGAYGGQSPQFQKVYYAPQQQSHPQQKQQTPPPPQTPGGSYIRTIPIFVEGRSEPIINNKEIPNQNAPPNVASGSGNSRAFTPPKQQPHRPTPLNTQQQPSSQQQQQQSGGLPPQTPHTVDTINKIQDIQRDVLELMSYVEKFSGTRADKEYVYLDEMLTRNLLKLDNIDTNGKESIRLARKEAIKCIQASINVLEAKAEENKKAVQVNDHDAKEAEQPVLMHETESPAPATETQISTSADKVTKEPISTASTEQIVEPAYNKTNEPIPLPPPESQKFNEVKIEDCPDDDVPKVEDQQMDNTTETK